MKCPVWQLRIPEDHWCRWPWLQWLSCTAPIKARTLSETVCGSEYRFPKRSSALWLSHKISSISSSGPLFSGPFWLCKMCGSTWLVASGHNRKSHSPWWVGFPPPQAFPFHQAPWLPSPQQNHSVEMSRESPLSHRLQVLVGSASNLLQFYGGAVSFRWPSKLGPPLSPKATAARAAVTVSGWVPAGASTITQHLTGSVSLCFDPLERTRNKDQQRC